MSATTHDLNHDTDDITAHARAHAVDPGSSTFHRLIATSHGIGPAIARLALGLVILPHALEKTFGWFGGFGLRGTYEGFTQKMGLPGPIAALAILFEVAGTVMLLLGLVTRAGAAMIIALMLGAILTVHLPNGFFMNWSGTQAGEGFEYHLLAIALGVIALIEGGGRASIDRAFSKWRPAEGGPVSPVLTQD